MNVGETVLLVMDNELTEIISYVARVNGSWFAVSMLEEYLYCFEVHQQEFVDYALNNGLVLLMDEVPEDVYRCFIASFLVIAENLSEREIDGRTR